MFDPREHMSEKPPSKSLRRFQDMMKMRDQWRNGEGCVWIEEEWDLWRIGKATYNPLAFLAPEGCILIDAEQ